MHHLSAYVGSIANGAVDTLLPAVADQTINVIDQRYQFPTNREILMAYASINTGTAVRLSSPSYNRGLQPVIDPIDADTTVGGNLPAIVEYNRRGPEIPRLENFGPLVSRDGVGAADCYVALWHTGGFQQAPPGKIVTIRGTANASGAANGWRLGSFTPDQSLPNGRYAVVGMRVTGANALLARLVFPSQFDRPGTYANVSAASWNYPSLRFGMGGLFGTFINTNLPQIEVLGFDVVATQVVSLDLIPIGMM